MAGTFFTATVEIGDVLIAEVDSPTVEADWTIINKNLDAASIKTNYESNADTNAFTNAEQLKLSYITVNSAINLHTLKAAIALNTAKVTNVSTNLSTAYDTTTVTIQSSDGTNAIIASATSLLAGIMTTTIFDEHEVNNAKVSDINHNVTTNISVGTVTAINVPIVSSDGTGIATLPAATDLLAGIVTNGAQAFGGTKSFANLSGTSASSTLDSFVLDGGTF